MEEKFKKLHDLLAVLGHPDSDSIGQMILNKDYNGVYDYLEKNRDTLRKLPGYKDVELTRPDTDKSIKKLIEDYKTWQDIPDEWKKSVANENNISENDLHSAYELQKSMDLSYKNIDAEEAAREARRKELENLPYIAKAMMSEESKKRYIETPEKSLFYYEKRLAELEDEKENALEGIKKQPGFLVMTPEKQKEMLSNIESDYDKQINDLKEKSSTLSDRFDIALGGAGAGADMVPGMKGVFVGPALRAIRDVKNMYTGDFEGDISDLLYKRGGDLVGNIGVNYGPTAILATISQRSKTAASDVSGGLLADKIFESSQVKKYKDMEKDLSSLGKMTKNALLKKEQKLEKMSPDIIIDAYNNNRKIQSIENIENKFAKDISSSNFYEDIVNLSKNENIPITEAADKYLKTAEGIKKALESNRSGLVKVVDNNGKKDLLLDPIAQEYLQATNKNLADYNKLLQASKTSSKTGNLLAGARTIFDDYGSAAVKTAGNVKRDSDIPEEKENRESKLKKLGLSKENKKSEYNDLETIIQNTAPQWKLGFKPRENQNDPMYRAYLLWKTRGDE